MTTRTAFTTQCWASAKYALIGILLFLTASFVSAGTIEPINGQLDAVRDGYALSADFAIDLGPRLEEAVTHGVPLIFNLEFSIERKRWYWLNQRIVGRVIEYRLAYNALTQQYRLSVGGLHSSHATLAEALNVLGHVRQLVVADKSAIPSGSSYLAELKLELDRSQLPKPFQVDMLAGKDWQIESKTLNWQFMPGVVGR